MTTYHVLLESKPTVAQPAETVTVHYAALSYNEAWVGARTVCRLGTLFKTEERCKNPNNCREFYTPDGEPFHCSPAVYTVRRIFVENTRKRGKQRMTSLTAEQLLTLIDEKGLRVSHKLRDTLADVIGNSEGLRVTTAVARRLGLRLEEDES